MVKHVILWTLKNDMTPEKTQQVKSDIKKSLEALAGKIPGLLSIKVNTQPLAGSNADIILDSCFENEEALRNYAVNPLHVAVANSKVRPYTATRTCMDYRV